MSKTIKIFGYGSLVNVESTRHTCPNFKYLFPAKLKGFVRVFNIKESRQFNRKNGGTISCLNLDKSEYNHEVNGLCFEVSLDELECLQEREKEYEMIQIEISDYNNSKNIHKAFTFRVKHFEAFPFQENSLAQKEYLEICLEGCREISEDFLNKFKKTTFIGDKTIEELNL